MDVWTASEGMAETEGGELGQDLFILCQIGQEVVWPDGDCPRTLLTSVMYAMPHCQAYQTRVSFLARAMADDCVVVRRRCCRVLGIAEGLNSVERRPKKSVSVEAKGVMLKQAATACSRAALVASKSFLPCLGHSSACFSPARARYACIHYWKCRWERSVVYAAH